MDRTGFRTAGLATLVALFAACGGGEIDVSEIDEGSILNRRAATLRDGGELVTGTVVRKTPGGQILDEKEYVDGFPNGRAREWYENGQPKREGTVRFEDRGQHGGRLVNLGTYRTWCENGTLESESQSDDEGRPTGVSRTWSCTGKPLQERTLPFGPIKVWNQLPDSEETVLVQEGTTVEGGGWDGVHKTWWPSNGKPRLEERWVNGVLDGEYKTWLESGELEQSGSYAAGQKVGTWVQSMGTRKLTTEYDPSLYVDSKYADAFMAATGIEYTRNLALRNLRADLEKIRYYASQGLVDVKKRLDFTPQSPGEPFQSTIWTYPYVLASAEALPLLVELGADPKAVDSEGRTRLFYCIYSLGADRFCNGAEAKRLIDLGMSPNHADVWGNTSLHEVVKTHPYLGDVVSNDKRLEVGRLLMEAGADPDVVNGEGRTPLMLAVLTRQFPLATAMLERSKQPGATDREGLNLIHLAFYVELGNQFQFQLTDEVRSFVELAASKGVDPAAKVGDMGTLKAIAEQVGAIDLAQFLAGLKG